MNKTIIILIILMLACFIYCEERWVVAELFNRTIDTTGFYARLGLQDLYNAEDVTNLVPILWMCSGEHQCMFGANRLSASCINDITPLLIMGGRGRLYNDEFHPGMYPDFRALYDEQASEESPLVINLSKPHDEWAVDIYVEIIEELEDDITCLYTVVTTNGEEGYFALALYAYTMNFEISDVGDTIFHHYPIFNHGYDYNDIAVCVFAQEGGGNITQAARLEFAEAEYPPVQEDEICFPATMVGNTSVEYVTITNYEEEDLNICCYMPDGFTGSGYFTVPGESSWDIEITFAPQQPVYYRDNMVIATNNEQYLEINVTLEGQGLDNVDIDNSCVSDAVTCSVCPNPFNPQIEIRYSLQQKQQVCISIYDIKGNLIKNLSDQEQDAGAHLIEWDGKDNSGLAVSSGIYLFKLSTPTCQKSQKITLLK